MTRRRLLGPVAALVTLAVLGGSGAAVAGWSANTALSTTASSAAAATTVSHSGSMSTTYQYAGTASAPVFGSITIKNTGSTPLSYRLATEVTGSTTLAQKTALSLWTGTCSGSIPAQAVKTTLADPAPTLPTAARSLAAGAQAVVCVATNTTGSNTELQGQSLTAAFRVTGTVGTNWTATATTQPVTQSVYGLAAAGAVTCADERYLGFRMVRLSWTAPANRPSRSEITYQVVDTASGSVIREVKSSAAATSVIIEGKDLDRNGTYTFAVRAKENLHGTTAPLTAGVTVTRSSGALGVISATECS